MPARTGEIADARIARFYYDAIQIVIANRDQARAESSSRRARVRFMLEGKMVNKLRSILGVAGPCAITTPLHSSTLQVKTRL
jgi:hypothetical protein